MIVKIITECNFVGCDTVHYVEVPDEATDEDVLTLAKEYLEEDIRPSVYWRPSSVEEADDEGYDID